MIPALLLLMAPAVTFHADVEPILQRHCQTCHRAGEIAPMSLMTYQEIRPWAKAIRQSTRLKRMPPWFAAQGGPFSNHSELTAAELAMIDAWVTAGAKQGDRRAAPPPVQWSAGWSMPRPGLVLTAPKAFEVPAKGDVDYQMLILPLHLLEDRWVSAAEIRPGARTAVHHIVAYIREPGSEWLRDTPRGQYVRASGGTTADILAVYTPGQSPFQAMAGMAKKIPAGSDVVLQFHYTPDGEARKDQTSVGLSFAKEPPQKRILTLQLNQTTFRIPPMEANHRVSVAGTLPNDALLLSMFPHMHLRGKAFEYEIDGGEGRVETLLRVAPYRFNWQLNYVLATPRVLKKGTRLRATAWYDNSPNNPWNPDASKEVVYGEQSWAEMMVGFFDVAVDPALDKAAFFLR